MHNKKIYVQRSHVFISERESDFDSRAVIFSHLVVQKVEI